MNTTTTSCYTLEDATLRAAISKTFFIPSKEEIEVLVPGRLVKLIFGYPRSTTKERMWVEISTIEPDGKMTGVLKNEPALSKDLKFLQMIHFETKNIISIFPEEALETDTEAGNMAFIGENQVSVVP